MPYDQSDVSQFGIRDEDEHVHPAAPDELHWNESVFYDWIASPTLAGHVRIGRMPNQGRAWLWVFLLTDGEWAVLEEPRLPVDALNGFDYEGRGLRFRRVVDAPLRKNTLSVAGTARVVSGVRTGQLVPFDVELRFEARGPAHSLGEQTMSGHSAALYSSNRYEQPVAVTGSQRVGDARHDVVGHGERDHSWGPRYWNMQWFFLVLHGESMRLQCARIVFDEDSYLSMGYVGRDRTVNVVDAEFDLTFDDSRVREPYAGSIRLVTETDEVVEGRLETLDGCAIDASHAFDPPQPSVYRRAIVRFHPSNGGDPLMGWLEINRFPNGVADEGFP